MNNKNEKIKKEFLHREVCYLCFVASLGMARKIPFYKKGVIEKDKNIIKQYLRDELWEMLEKYLMRVDESQHIENIEKFQIKTNNKFLEYIENGGFTFGRAQKLINLYLKYFWVCGYIQEPPHCPVDSIIIKKIGRDFQSISFSKMNKISYKKIIEGIKGVKKDKSIAQWELFIFNRR